MKHADSQNKGYDLPYTQSLQTKHCSFPTLELFKFAPSFARALCDGAVPFNRIIAE